VLRRFCLANATRFEPIRGFLPGEVAVASGRFVAELPVGARRVDLGGRPLLPGLVNGHDHLDLSSFSALGRPPYANVYDWARHVDGGAGDLRSSAGLAVPVLDRLFLGGLRNLLSGVTSVAHHAAWRRSFGSGLFRALGALRHGIALPAGFPVRVLERYGWVHSLGLGDVATALRATADHAPFMIHAAEGTDARARAELSELAERGWLDDRTLIVHGVGLDAAAIALIVRHGAAVVLSPESNLYLYGATAPLAALRAAGVPLALGSDSPVSGVRDLLSTLATLARESGLAHAELLRLATSETADRLRLEAGRLASGASADLIVLEDLQAFCRGERTALALVVREGRALFGQPQLLEALGARFLPIWIDGQERGLEPGYARLLARLLVRYPQLADTAWLQGVRVAS